MGLFSAIGSVLSAAGSAIVSGISNVCSTIGGAVFSGVSGIAGLAKDLVFPALGLELSEIIIAIQLVSVIISTVAELLGLKGEETPEELGLKAEQADKKPEDFDSIQEYIDYLRNEVEVDKSKLDNLSQEEKVTYGAIGSAICVKGIEEKYGMEMSGDFWTTVAKMGMKGQEVKTYIDHFKLHDIHEMKDMTDYIKGVHLDENKDRHNIGSAILDALKELNPELSDESLKEKLLDMHVEG